MLLIATVVINALLYCYYYFVFGYYVFLFVISENDYDVGSCFARAQRTPLNELIYVADNLAYFPYQQQDEPLFIMHQLDIIVSVSGSNLLQSFREVCVLVF